jgi:uncharacterized protein YndB with AHSA1/START domain
MPRDLHLEAVYPHPIEKVWRAITDPTAISQWLMENDFEPRLGHKFQFRSKPQPGWDGIAHCKVIEVNPPRCVAWTWRGGPLDTVLRITPEPAPEGTKLVLDHTGFRGWKARIVSRIMGSGWKGIVAKHIPAVVDRMKGMEIAPGPSMCEKK